jgi:Xanthine/uracil permeases
MSFKTITSFLILFTLLCSCADVSKRKYRSGYYIEWKSISQIVEKKEFSPKSRTSKIEFQKKKTEKLYDKNNKIQNPIAKKNVTDIQKRYLHVVQKNKNRDNFNTLSRNKVQNQFEVLDYSFLASNQDKNDETSRFLIKILGTLGVLLLVYILFLLLFSLSFLLAFYESIIWAAVVFFGGIILLIGLTIKLLKILWRKKTEDKNSNTNESEKRNLLLRVGTVVTLLSMIILYIFHQRSFR